MVGEIAAWTENGHTLYEFDTDMSTTGIDAALQEEGVDPSRLEVGYNGRDASVQSRSRAELEAAHQALLKHD